MIMVLWALSFLFMLLLTLVIHELGHLVVSRMTRTKASSFQIGAGPRLVTLHTGRTLVKITGETLNLKPDQPELQAGDMIRAYIYRKEPDEHYTANAIFRDDKSPIGDESWRDLLDNSRDMMQIKGRLRELTPGQMVVADMEWSLRALPILAGVILNDDPRKAAPEAYNTLPWRKQAAITLAGPLANIAAALTALIMVATFPMGGTHANTWQITEVQQGSPAEAAGIQTGDQIVRVGNLIYPSMAELRKEITKAARNGAPVGIGLLRGDQSIDLQVMPGQNVERIGVRLEYLTTIVPDYPMDLEHVARRIISMGERYTSTLWRLAREASNPETRNSVAAGPVRGSYEILRTTQYAGISGWLIFLATLNLGVAACNMLPIPPQDGYRIIAEGVQAARKGKPINQGVEAAIFIGGTAAVAFLTMYLIVNDISRLLG